jgi:hypothetical protein
MSSHKRQLQRIALTCEEQAGVVALSLMLAWYPVHAEFQTNRGITKWAARGVT